MTTSQVVGGTAHSVRHKVVQAIHSPLGFFALALLIVEVFLFGAGVWFDLSAEWRIVAVGIGIFLFLIVFATVVLLVIKYPKNLVFSEESHLQYDRMQIFGTEERAITGRTLTAQQVDVAPPHVGQLPPIGDPPTE